MAQRRLPASRARHAAALGCESAAGVGDRSHATTASPNPPALFADCFFGERVENAFIGEFQSAPLDLDVRSLFYANRKEAIDRRLCELRGYSAQELFAYTRDQCAAHRGELARGLNWARHTDVELALVASCIGPRPLAAACLTMCADYNKFSSGLPDLLLISITRRDDGSDVLSGVDAVEAPAAQGEAEASGAVARSTRSWAPQVELGDGSELSQYRLAARFVEVKGPGDKLSDSQCAWMDVLVRAGADVEVAYVERC